MSRCSLCNNFERHPRQFRVSFDFTPDEITRSAGKGCIVCSLLLQGMLCFTTAGGFAAYNRVHVWGGSIDGNASIEIEIYQNGTMERRLEVFVAKSKNSLFKGARTLPTIPGDTASAASMQWARRVLQHCSSSHASCRRQNDPNLPTRILELSTDEDGKSRVRLLKTSDEKAQYACLSHCWGNVRELVTERHNLASHAKGIRWDALPKTFRDAVLIVRDLGLKYLWIDSLCIVQDDLNDWRRESANMSSTYANSYITIAATKSPSDMGGCFSTRSSDHQDHRLSLIRPDSSKIETDLYIREKIAHIGDQGAVTPLLRRGWVCQERLLSPKVLHFCEKELVWECRTFSGCQCSCFNPKVRIKAEYSAVFQRAESKDNKPNEAVGSPKNRVQVLGRTWAWLGTKRKVVADRPSSQHFSNVPIPPDPAGQEAESSASSTVDENVVFMWRRIVSEYSGQSLTNTSDRLPAVAGLARSVAELLGTDYLAGLWRCALPDDLLWFVDEKLQEEQQNPLYRAPSWSWASVDERVDYYRVESQDPGFSILQAACTPVTNVDPFGEVQTGSLEVYARLMPIRINLDMFKDTSSFSRRLQVPFLGETATFIADHNMSTVNRLTGTFCIGEFISKQRNACDTVGEEELTVSLIIKRIEMNRYERIGILERKRRSGSEKQRCSVAVREASGLEDRDERERIILV